MSKNIILLTCLLLFFPTLNGYANQDDMISGEIITGYRVLPVEPANKEINFTVYRGDYIKFSFSKDLGSLDFSVPELKYKDKVSANTETSPFFKMKNTGHYSFTLGDISGKINVIELIRPNYSAVTADEAAEILKNLEPFILDVRTQKEYEQFHIEGTYLIPIQQLQARMNELESRKHEDIFVYCATGNRSTVAARIMANSGFKRIYNLRYGLYDWAQKGYPYTSGK